MWKGVIKIAWGALWASFEAIRLHEEAKNAARCAGRFTHCAVNARERSESLVTVDLRIVRSEPVGTERNAHGT